MNQVTQRSECQLKEKKTDEQTGANEKKKVIVKNGIEQNVE